MLLLTLYHCQASVSKRQLLFIQTIVWEQSIKGTGIFYIYSGKSLQSPTLVHRLHWTEPQRV